MAGKKQIIKHVLGTKTEETIVEKTNKPLIFISHDSRDAELAEEFSNLLKSASIGALRSFVSSDKKGTRGIEYGQEWYPAIMDKIDEASEVICLLTQRSVDRPWVLYEAGVAKGKLNKKVIGIAIGIQHTVAFTGPFAQFQNNDGSVESITKLVMDLIKKVPAGLEPEHNTVEGLVQIFHKKAADIVKKSQGKPEKVKEETNEKIVAKLFEEVKIMFESLPSKIENRIDPEFKRRRRKFHPMMFEEMMHMAKKFGDSNLGFLMMIGIFKEDCPWLYELGLETYRDLKTLKTISAKKEAISKFEKAIEMLGHPMMREFFSKSDEMYMFSNELRHFTHHYFERFLADVK